MLRDEKFEELSFGGFHICPKHGSLEEWRG
jgi:hypothetical protein